MVVLKDPPVVVDLSQEGVFQVCEQSVADVRRLPAPGGGSRFRRANRQRGGFRSEPFAGAGFGMGRVAVVEPAASRSLVVIPELESPMNSPAIPLAIRELGKTSPYSGSGIASSAANSSDPNPAAALMPDIMRIESIERHPLPDGLIYSRAVLFHMRCTVCVGWVARQTDERLSRNSLVIVSHGDVPCSTSGVLNVAGLHLADQPISSLNIFETIPSNWIADREIVKRAAVLWEQLPPPLAHLLNAIFWDAKRFQRYVMGPSSLRHHHSEWNGNFRHSVEVAEHAWNISQRVRVANDPLLIAAGLLHDAAKADEYRYDRSRRSFYLSDRGELIGHRDSLIEWIAAARDYGNVGIAEDMYLTLLHTINATKGPAWLGLRDPRCIEADILSMADRISVGEETYSEFSQGRGKGGLGRFLPPKGRHRRAPLEERGQ